MRAKNLAGSSCGRSSESETVPGFSALNLKYFFPAVILLIGVCNNCFVNWIEVKVNLPVGKFLLFQRLTERHGHGHGVLDATLTGTSGRRLRASLVDLEAAEGSDYSRRFQPENETDSDFSLDVLGAGNVTFVFRVDRPPANDSNLLANRDIENRTSADVNDTLLVEAKRVKVKKVVLAMSRSGWMSLEETVFLSHRSSHLGIIRIPWDAFTLDESETGTESETESRSSTGIQKLISIFDGQSSFGRVLESTDEEEIDDYDDGDDYEYRDVTKNVTRRRRRHHRHHHSRRQSLLIMMTAEFLLCLVESGYREIKASVDCVNDSMVTIAIATIAFSVLVAVASLLSFSYKSSQPENSAQSLKFAVSAFLFGFAALFQLLSLILFIQSTSDVHFCFNERASLVPGRSESALEIRYGSGFYVAILIFLLTNMAAVAASGRRCEDVMMAFKI